MTAEQSSSTIRVPLPGSGFMVTYRSQGERDRTLRLAEARQQIAHEGNGNPTWQELTEDERGTSELSARNWLRAAERAGLLAAYDDTDGGEQCPECRGRGVVWVHAGPLHESLSCKACDGTGHAPGP